MAANKARWHERERMKLRIADLWAQSKTSTEIALEVGISTRGAEYWITKIRREIAHRISDFEAVRAEQLSSLRRLRTEAWAAWVRSQQDAETEIEEVTTGGQTGGGTKNATRRVGQTGEASYLATIEKSLRAERDLLGLDAPKRAELTIIDVAGRRVNLNKPEEVATLSRDELEEIAQKMGLPATVLAP